MCISEYKAWYPAQWHNMLRHRWNIFFYYFSALYTVYNKLPQLVNLVSCYKSHCQVYKFPSKLLNHSQFSVSLGAREESMVNTKTTRI
jgi:hypothetical protein